MKHITDKRKYKHYRVIYLHLNRNTNRDIAKSEGFCEHTVDTYIAKYHNNDIEVLNIKNNLCAPRILTLEQEMKLTKVISVKTPYEVSLPNRKASI